MRKFATAQQNVVKAKSTNGIDFLLSVVRVRTTTPMARFKTPATMVMYDMDIRLGEIDLFLDVHTIPHR
jgi:hypothetical protein